MLKLTLLWTLCLFLLPVLLLQGVWTRKSTLKLAEAAHPDAGKFGAGEPKMTILGLGDSVIAGVGVEHLEQSLTAQVARSLAEKTGHGVSWQVQGKNGDRVSDLLARFKTRDAETDTELQFSAAGDLIEEKLPGPGQDKRPDFVIISIGVNDVSHLTSLTRWHFEVTELIAELRECYGVPIVFLGIPPMGLFPALAHPLRFALGIRAAMLDKTIQRAAELLPDVLWIDARSFFHRDHMALDGYHPSASGCELMGDQIAAVLSKIAPEDQSI